MGRRDEDQDSGAGVLAGRSKKNTEKKETRTNRNASSSSSSNNNKKEKKKKKTKETKTTKPAKREKDSLRDPHEGKSKRRSTKTKKKVEEDEDEDEDVYEDDEEMQRQGDEDEDEDEGRSEEDEDVDSEEIEEQHKAAYEEEELERELDDAAFVHKQVRPRRGHEHETMKEDVVAGDERFALEEFGDTEDTKERLFRFVVQKVTVRQTVEQMRPKVQFMVGGTREKVFGRRGKVTYKGYDGPTLMTGLIPSGSEETPSWDKIGRGNSGTLLVNKRLQWRGSYKEVASQKLRVQVTSVPMFCWIPFHCNFCTTEYGEGHLPLSKLANGPFEQNIRVFVREPNGKRVHTCTVTAEIIFEEVLPLEIEFADWILENNPDISVDDEVYLSIWVEPSIRRFFRRGGYFDRSCVSPNAVVQRLCDVSQARDIAEWSDVGAITYFGGLSEFENEDLHIEVYRSGIFSKLIGKACIPLAGVIESQILSARLSLDEPHPSASGNRLVEKGIIQGTVEIKNPPRFQQIGWEVKPKPHHTYLVFNVIRCENLIAADDNGYSDPFVEVSFDGIRLRTASKRMDLNPTFNKVLFLPLQFVDKSVESLRRKPRIEVRVYDADDTGNDILGSVKIPIFRIFKGRIRELNKKIHGREGSVHSYDDTLELFDASGQRTQQKISFSCFFMDDLQIEESSDWFDGNFNDMDASSTTDVSHSIEMIGNRWRRYIVDTCRKDGEFPFKRMEENRRFFFLPRFVRPFQILRRSIFDLGKLFRMVRMIPWQDSSQEFIGHADVWPSPQYLSDTLKGPVSTHALLLVNLLLSSKVDGGPHDAYIVIGRVNSGISHTWVMTRDRSDASVTFWEPTNGKKYFLSSVWDPSSHASPQNEGNPASFDEPIIEVENEQKMDVIDDWEIFLDQENSAELDKDSALRAQNELREFHQFIDELSLDMPSRHVTFQNEFSDAIDFFPSSELIDIDSSQPDIVPESSSPSQSHPYETIEVVFNGSNLWANIGDEHPNSIRYNLSDSTRWYPFITEEVRQQLMCDHENLYPFYDDVRLKPQISESERQRRMMAIAKEIRDSFQVIRSYNNMGDRGDMFLDKISDCLTKGCEILERIETSSPSKIDGIRETWKNSWLEFKDSQQTLNQMNESENPSAFRALRSEVEKNRERFRKALEEYALYDFNGTWRSSLMRLIPQGVKFIGRPFNFTQSDSKMIRKYIMEHYESCHTEKRRGTKFAVGVYVGAYPMYVTSTWVFIAKLVPEVQGSSSEV